MPLQKGRQSYLAIAEETTRLTAATTGFKYLPWTDLTAPGNENEYKTDESAYGNRGKLLNEVLISQSAPVNFGGHLDADNILMPLYSVFGTATPTTALGATTWVFSLNQAIENKTFTVQYNSGQEGEKKVHGWMASKLDIELTPENATFTLEGNGLMESDGTELTPVYTDPTKYLLGRHTTVGYATTLAGLSASTPITELKSVKVNFDTGLDINRHLVLGSLNPTNNSQDGFGATFELTFIVDKAQASTLKDLADAGDGRAFRVDSVASNLPVIGTSALKPTLRFDLPPSKFKITRELPLDDYIMMTLIVNVAHSELIVPTLINEISAI